MKRKERKQVLTMKGVKRKTKRAMTVPRVIVNTMINA
jgi:hypothetical protein